MSERDVDKLRDGMGLPHDSARETENAGRVEQAVGDLKEGVGSATGNKDMQVEGAAEKAEGVVKEALGESSREINNAIENVSDAAKS